MQKKVTLLCNFIWGGIEMLIMMKGMHDKTFLPTFLLTAIKCLFQYKIIRTRTQVLMIISTQRYCTNDANSGPQLVI